MNAARFNFSHGTHEEQLARLNMFTAVRESIGCPVATILDTKGPEIRICSFQSKSIELQTGDTFTLTTEEVMGNQSRVSVTYEEINIGQQILIDDSLVGIQVEKIRGKNIVCSVTNGGTLSSNKSINIPGIHIQLPSLTEKDIADIRFGIENDFDFIAASFIRKAADVEAIRDIINTYGGEKSASLLKLKIKKVLTTWMRLLPQLTELWLPEVI